MKKYRIGSIVKQFINNGKTMRESLDQEMTPTTASKISGRDILNEEIAAVATALHLYFNDVHDIESEIITIETPSARYSPWAQKHLVMKKIQRKN